MTKFLIAIVFGIASSLFGASGVFAGTEHNISGYAWSSNIGWVSFNCMNHDPASCDDSNFGVNLDSNGFITGYVWSPNIGWIQFGNLSDFPSGGGTQSTNARVSGSSVLGWARALSHSGGWDGWISLSGTGYGVGYNDGVFSGYAWGSDVIGWLLFDVQQPNLDLDPPYTGVCPDCGVMISSSGGVYFDVRSGGAGGSSIAGDSDVPHLTAPTFVWTLSNMPDATCSLSKTSSEGTEFTTVNGITESGSASGPALIGPNSYDFELACSNPSITKTVSFSVAGEFEGFSLGNAEIMRIQFLGGGSSESEPKGIFVMALGGFSEDVIVGVDTDPSASTCPAAKYSLGGSEYTEDPDTVTLSSDYSAGALFRVELAGPISGQCRVQVYGTSQGMTVTKDFIVTVQDAQPVFEEI
ncbi:MAG: hypothetical protein Q8L64_06685 [bacterium]|nr:hypothetical protein [bacterium]